MSETQTITQELIVEPETKHVKPHKTQVLWFHTFMVSLFQVLGLAGLFLVPQAKWQTIVSSLVILGLSKIGSLAGSHRLWSHRSYKANAPLRIILIVIQAMAYEKSAFNWARDHRNHHKFCETDADPHNAKRGFFFAHMGWLMCRKHPDVITKGKTIDLSDLYADKICMFQHNHYYWFVTIFCFGLPTLVPWYFWNESLTVAFLVGGMLRCILGHHTTWTINSIAHLYGRRPYDKNIYPTETRLVSFLTGGEGFHNYHHTFPWDYAASEFGYDLNMSKLFIDTFALIGWVTDRKVVSPEMIKARKMRTGDVFDHGPYGIYN